MSNPVIILGENLAAKFVWLQSNAQSDNNYIIEVNADENIDTSYQNLSFDGKTNITITLIGIDSMRTIILSNDGCMFIVGTGITLILDNNITLRGRNNNTHPLVTVDGNLIMNPGSAITGNNKTNTDFPGGGVFVLKDGTFTMNGGTISNNTTNRNGGGVAVDGNFILKDGSITGNNAKSNGGGVVMGPDAVFTMNGGTISNNKAIGSGGGVIVGEDAAFTMSGGTISGNKAVGGGGVCVIGHFIMSGGTISGNTGLTGGGGVSIFRGSFSKTGGIITGYANDTNNGNIAKENGITKDGQGHAIVVLEKNQFTKFKDTTSKLTDNMSYNANNGTSIGAWKKVGKTSNSSGCYVATCIYGSYDCPEVCALRRYRDNKLSNSYLGRCFIQSYYAISPKIVKLFGNKKWFNNFWKPILNKFVRKLLNSGIDNSHYSDA